ncbi:MAG: hypothetical protein Q27BPR15_18930 [Rhodobacter sp. CACIA14H1]|nr:MAG: hypothetical protein Q27BPR15_18930 [Rhodobacter sp. CACIA14H1]
MQRPDDLDELLAAARDHAPAPSDALMARVLADALAEQPAPRPAVAVVAQAGVLSRLASVFGGMGALAGMGTAAAAGLLIGYVQPSGLDLLGDAVLGAPVETVELVPDVATLLAGGE